MKLEIKYTKIVPVPKNNKLGSIVNSRPVAVLSPPAKIIESCIFYELWELVENRIKNRQHGFVKERSIFTNLMAFLPYVYPVVKERYQVDVVYTDFSKAFDKVRFVLLMLALERIGVPA